MSDKLVDMRNIRFVLYEVLDAETLCEAEYFSDHNRETFDMVLDTAYQLAREVFWPTYQTTDQEGAKFDGQKTTTPAGVKEVWKHCKEGGWFGPAVPYEYGGQQLPMTVAGACSFMFNAGNTSAYMYVGASGGAAYLISLFGTDEQKAAYLERLWTGDLGGTMCLSEPDVGSSLGDITTIARPAADGDYYHIKGVKRWISSGDHDLADNIIHPVLAKIEGAPPGSKGISLFIVPKYRLNEDGSPGEFNDVNTAGIEHKLGLRAQATATLNLGEKDNCHGWLLGEANNGLKHMLHLVNNARIHTGLQAIAQASAAYHVALQYARERLQGRPFTDPDPTKPPVAIIRHADVRNMLLQQKSYVEGVYMLLAFAASLNDRKQLVGAKSEEGTRLEDLLGILTPVCKGYGSDISFESIRLAIQTLGGAGFTEDFPVAQMLRDCKVFSIYEGTNAIQGQDLLGRRVVKKNGESFRILMAEMQQTIEEAAGLDEIKDLSEKVQKIMEEVAGLTMHLGQIGMSGDVELYMANATLYHRVFSEMVVSWMWLKQAVVAQRALAAGSDEDTFYRGKIAAARFYADNVLPHAHTNAKIIKNNERSALDFQDAWFDGSEQGATANA